MNKLIKFSGIIFIFVFISVLLMTSMQILLNNWQRYGLEVAKEFEMVQGIGGVLFIFGCIVTIILSIFYVAKNPTLRGYFESLVLPVLLIILTYIGIFLIYFKFDKPSGENGVGFLFIVIGQIYMLVSLSIVNLIIFLVKRRRWILSMED